MVMTPRKNSTGKRARKEKAFARDEPTAWRRADSSEKQELRGGSHENDDASIIDSTS